MTEKQKALTNVAYLIQSACIRLLDRLLLMRVDELRSTNDVQHVHAADEIMAVIEDKLDPHDIHDWSAFNI